MPHFAALMRGRKAPAVRASLRLLQVSILLLPSVHNGAHVSLCSHISVAKASLIGRNARRGLWDPPGNARMAPGLPARFAQKKSRESNRLHGMRQKGL
jgi:hypothetical protein